MAQRTVEAILSEWRAAEAELELDPDDVDPELKARIDALISEHARAMVIRRQEAEDLAERPASRFDD